MAYGDRTKTTASSGLVPGYVARIEFTARLSAIAVIAIGATVLLGGWLFDVDGLRSALTEGVTMKANTAAGLILCGASLLLLCRPGPVSGAARVGAGAVIALGAITLLEYAAGWDLGIDQLLFEESGEAAKTYAPGRMGIQASVSFVLAGIALLMLDWRPRGHWPAGALAGGIGTGAGIVLLGHAYDITSLYAIQSSTAIAAHTAAAFLLLAVGIGCTRPRQGLTAVLASDSPAGVTTRSLLPPALVVPPVVGTLVMAAKHNGILGDDQGIWLITVATVVGCVTFAVATAASLQKADAGRRMAERRLDQQERRFRTMVEQMPLILYVDALDDVNTPLYVSPQVEATLGYTPDEWVADPALFEQLVHEDDRERVMNGIARFCRTGELFRDEYRLRARDGRWVWIQDTTVQVLDPHGHPLYAQGYMLDVSARREAEEERRELETQLGHAQKLEIVGQLAGGVAHDFNNLLGAISVYAGFAEEKAQHHPELVSDIAEIRRAVERGADLTNQLLTFSRKDVVRPRVIDLVQVVTDCRTLLHPLLGDDMRIRFRLLENPCCVEADPTQIERILLNLVLNARAAMPDGGQVEIRLEDVELDAAGAPVDVEPGRYVRLEVADTGHGMSPEVAARALEPFFTTKPAGEGTGLGLATVYGIVQRLGGHVVINTNLETGTTVTMLLPAADVDVALDEHVSPRVRKGGELVLVVDDDEALRTSTARLLSAHSYGVVEAVDGVDALEKFRNADPRPVLLLTDVVMPRMRGTQLASEVTSMDPRVRVVYMSGYANELAEGGASVHVIAKPFSSDALLGAVSEALVDTAPLVRAGPA